MYFTRASLERRILELVSVAVEAEDETSPWYVIRNESIHELVSSGNINSNESLEFVCTRCKKTPCLWCSVGLQILPTILSLLDEDEGEGRSNAEFRHIYYREVIKMMYGHLGAGNRREVPNCCLIAIRNLFPEDDPNMYVGYKPTSK